MSLNPTPEFGKIRAALWPIHTNELKKFIPMGLIMFCILFNYTILRDSKDVLIVTAPQSGAEVIPFIKGWCVTFSAFLFFFVYTKLSSTLSRDTLFYGIITSFITFFGVFAFFLYPNQHLIHPSMETIQVLQETYPNLRFIFPIYGIWSYVVFYVLAELWGSVALSLLFWQFANEITRTNEAKRFYALFALIANIALIASGATIMFFSKIRDNYPPEVDAWGVSLNWMMLAVVACGVACMGIYYWMSKNVLTDPVYYTPEDASAKTKKTKVKLGVVQSLNYLVQSRYLGYLAILVLGYGMSINLIEVVWKSQLKIAFPDKNDYAYFMGQFSSMTGIVTMTLIMLTKGIIRKYGWFTGAVITPLIVLITGGMFFALVFFNDVITPMIAGLGFVGISSTLLAAYVGAAQNFLSKGTKYSLFDPTKEMAYIPLDAELKSKGKAAVDVIGGRLGKGMGGWTMQALLISTGGTAISLFPYIGVIVAVVILIWVWAAKKLNKEYTALVENKIVTKAN